MSSDISQPVAAIIAPLGNGNEIINGILGKDFESTPKSKDEFQWSWEISNNYYTAAIKLSVINLLDNSKEWIDSCEALLLYYDLQKEDALIYLSGLLDGIGNFAPEVQLLVCDRVISTSGKDIKLDVHKWCISRGMELIELDPLIEDVDEDDDFGECYGFERIRQALETHTWSNLQMKSTASCARDSIVKVTSEKIKVNNDDDDINPSHYTDEDNLLNLGDDSLESLLHDTESEDFEALFSKFSLLKRKAETMCVEERKEFAEKVAVAFWKAIGGEEEEIEGLDAGE